MTTYKSYRTAAHIVLCFTISFCLAHSASAVSEEALDFSSLGNGADYYQGASYSLGWRFTAVRDIKVTELGFYDDKKDGLKESHAVGIYDVATKQLMCSTTVTAGDPLTGFFRYHPITPVVLTGGRDYYVVAVTGTERYAIFVSTLVVSSSIRFVDSVASYSTANSNQLAYPDTEVQGNGDWGPSFKIDNANPQSAAVDMPALTGTDISQSSFSTGYYFTPAKDVQVSSVGYYDDKGDGFKESHLVTIFDSATKNVVLPDTLVTSSDVLRGYFRYHPVAPVTLSAGREYVIMGTTGSDNYRRSVTTLSISPSINYGGSAVNPSAPTSGTAFPTEKHAGEPPFFGHISHRRTFATIEHFHPRNSKERQ